ncbi:hypothetical protein [Mucilaginibacter ginkgonis]|uniref:DUF4870 domain-containing protein n=1 Tax=Mucilaginibacter ginkgonis TaxID=2682091 RepID=A0A6I4HXS9_9SPHI|nr:hypothetical protein [Mucilaginibacter ginkgonis]QQL49469.1 DUF4870 domain-containing protein [Mucilaginibacter ginkgonis]
MELNNPTTAGGEGKIVAILSYLTFIGWLIGYFGFHQGRRTSLGSYHLRQGLYMFIVFLLIYIVLRILLVLTGALFIAYIMNIANIVYFILAIVGIINALNGVERPLPFIGKKAETYFPTL